MIGLAPTRSRAQPGSPEAALERLLNRVHDPEIGLVRFISEVPIFADEAPIHLAIAEGQNPFLVPPLADALRGAAPPKVATMGTGAGWDRTSALWATVGEAIERHALHLYDEAKVVRARLTELSLPAIRPDEFIGFADAQYDRPGFRFCRFDPNQEIGWAPAKRLSDGAAVLIPAAYAYMGYQHRTRGELFDSGYSTGGAAGPSIAAALVSGLFEVIERDGFACHWYLRHSPPEIDAQQYADRLSLPLRLALRDAPLRLRFFDLTTDLEVPTVLAVGLPRRGGIAIGASARLDFALAIEKAAIEAYHTHNWILDLQRAGVTLDPEAGIREYRDHVVYHLDPAHRATAEFLYAGGGQRRLVSEAEAIAAPAERLTHLIQRLGAQGYEAYGIDLTPPDLPELGLHVARAFVPGLHPLGSGTGNEHLDTRRLAQFASFTGLSLPTTLNEDPHPFP